MKNILLCIFAFIFIFASPVKSDKPEFCDGFKRGYIVGYKQTSGSGFDPFVPFCPFQPFKGINDPKSDYEHGYVIGYEKGKKEGRR